MKVGDTFLIEEPGQELDTHLWIVLSDPSIEPSKVLIVNITGWAEFKDQACILELGDHPWLTKRSCVNYGRAKVVSLDTLRAMVESGKIGKREPLVSAILRRVHEGAARSTRMRLEHADILIAQGLLPD